MITKTSVILVFMIITKAESCFCMVPLHLGGSATSAPGAQPLNVHDPTGKGIRVNHTAPSRATFLFSGLQNLHYQRYRIILLVFQPQRPSFPSSASHSFSESIQAFEKHISTRDCFECLLPLASELKSSEPQSLPHFNEKRKIQQEQNANQCLNKTTLSSFS